MSRFHHAVLGMTMLMAAGNAPLVRASGARSFKSGPIQITADGSTVWVANAHSDSVSRIDTSTYATAEFPLPADPTTGHSPRGLSVSEDGAEVWVACHDSDRVYVLSGTNGAVLARIDLPWGSGPYSIALSRPDASDGKQKRALVTLHRGAALAVLDVATRGVAQVLAPVFWGPLGVAWMEDGVSAWVTHPFADNEGPFLTRVEFTDPANPRVTAKVHVLSSQPLTGTGITNPPAEGGYLMPRGHLAQIPSASGRNEAWMPTQYSNIHDDMWSPDSSFQSVVRHLDLGKHTLPNTNVDKVILTAVNVHDPTSAGGAAYVGPGWNAHVAGPKDIAFSADGSMVYIVHEMSNDLVAMPTSTQNVRGGPGPLPEVPCGSRPMGLAVSPTANVAFVSNDLSGDVSVIDLTALAPLRPPVAVTAPPLGGGAIQRGAQLFHTSADPRISVSDKGGCASCHPNAEADGRGWTLQKQPDGMGNKPSKHGPRDTQSLLGMGLTFTPGQIDPATGFGELHRSGDRDEVQDFDWAFRGVLLGGTGMAGAGVCPDVAPPDPSCSNAGRSSDLDALAAYVMQLAPLARSPYRAAGGGLSEAAVRGATFFVGAAAPAKKADAACAGCHVPETGWVDFKFHDVGQAQGFGENELNNRTPAWSVNTPSLDGVWATPPYVGVTGFQNDLYELLRDLNLPGRRAPHGTAQGLTRRQLADLAEFVGSIDGELTAAQVRAAKDTTPPRVVRVEPVSLTRVAVWFSESVDPATAGDKLNWSITKQGGAVMPVTAAAFDPRNGDRVDLTTQLDNSCGATYTVAPAGAIYDLADTATGGVRNSLDLADAGNAHAFTLGATLAVTLGSSGYEDITVPVHDVSIFSTVGQLGVDSVWLDVGGKRKGFVRFDWEAGFKAATGVTLASDLVDASFSLTGDFGDAQPVELRRVLQKWSDVIPNETDASTAGRTTWTHRMFNTNAWNAPGAGAMGGTGTVASDYNAAFDASGVVDATVTPPTINLPASFAGPAVLDAFRFWFANPTLDYGYMLQLAAGTNGELKFLKSEWKLGDTGPVLTVTYKLPITAPTTPPEVSGPASPAAPLLAVKEGASGVHLYFEDLGAKALAYNVYEGAIGTWFSHAGAACGVSPPLASGLRSWSHAAAAGSRYFSVTASDACNEGPTPSGWPQGLNDCAP